MTKKQFKEIGQAVLGIAMIALAVTLLITAHEGADTISIFLLEILMLVDLPFWGASLIFNACVLGIVALFDRKVLGISSLINGFGLGLLIGIFEPVFTHVSINIAGYSAVAVVIA